MIKMFRAVILVFCLHAVLVLAKPPDWITDDMLAMVKGDKERCMAEHGTTEAMIDEVNNGNFPNEKALTCYVYCMMEAFSIMDEDGALELDILLGVLPENLQGPAKDVITPCAGQPGADPCEKIYNIARCIQSTRPDLFFMV